MTGRGAGYVAVQAVLMVAALLAPALTRATGWPVAVVVAGTVVAVLGIGMVALASVTLGRSLSPFPRPKDGAVLVSHGIFSVVRHPIYTGLTLLVLGWGLVWSSPATILGAVVLLAFFDVKARREERWLEATFTGYAEYRQRVRKLVPLVY